MHSTRSAQRGCGFLEISESTKIVFFTLGFGDFGSLDPRIVTEHYPYGGSFFLYFTKEPLASMSKLPKTIFTWAATHYAHSDQFRSALHLATKQAEETGAWSLHETITSFCTQQFNVATKRDPFKNLDRPDPMTDHILHLLMDKETGQ